MSKPGLLSSICNAEVSKFLKEYGFEQKNFAVDSQAGFPNLVCLRAIYIPEDAQSFVKSLVIELSSDINDLDMKIQATYRIMEKDYVTKELEFSVEEDFSSEDLLDLIKTKFQFILSANKESKLAISEDKYSFQYDEDIAGEILDEDKIECRLVVDTLKFCGCGAPRDTLLYIVNGLAFQDKHRLANYENGEAMEKNIKARFSDEEAYLFFLYFVNLDNYEFCEHGSSVYGSWLTTKGKLFMRDVKLYFKQYFPDDHYKKLIY